ncbi:hypothetical protein FIBSPDRAFT_590194 [Athelia psychrophila]|uniref:Uncharacterized protein n=1 Tax=Athelia psychrophila TaxID=1759441 RepID=A0A166H8L0_9AGAM|nr:hypothetical protein FIBSPDRAFT_590194 [Fibularhizoctonia sp. CBS 109695]
MLDVGASARPRYSLLILHQPSSFWRVTSPLQSNTRSNDEKLDAHLTSPHSTSAPVFLHPNDMHAEPLFAVWGPVALQALKRNVEMRVKSGSCFVLYNAMKRMRKWVTCSRGMICGSSTRTCLSSEGLPQELTRTLGRIQHRLPLTPIARSSMLTINKHCISSTTLAYSFRQPRHLSVTRLRQGFEER